MRADEHLRCLAHGLDVQLFADTKSASLAQRTGGAVPDEVAILAPLRPVSRLEATIDLLQLPDADVSRQQRSDCPLELATLQPTRVGEGDHLATGVDSGIRSAGAIDAHPGAARELREGFLKLSLHRPCSRLNLEAGKVSSVVFDPRAVTNGDVLSNALCLAAFVGGIVFSCQTSSS